MNQITFFSLSLFKLFSLAIYIFIFLSVNNDVKIINNDLVIILCLDHNGWRDIFDTVNYSHLQINSN